MVELMVNLDGELYEDFKSILEREKKTPTDIIARYIEHVACRNNAMMM